jgi:hypothetical protein
VTTQRIYKENHYVTQWYQRRFLPSTGEQKFRYLDLRPQTFVDAKGIKRQKKNLQRWGPDRCFKQTDLYTTRFGALLWRDQGKVQQARELLAPVYTTGLVWRMPKWQMRGVAVGRSALSIPRR